MEQRGGGEGRENGLEKAQKLSFIGNLGPPQFFPFLS